MNELGLPETDDETAQMEPSVVLYADVLGFKSYSHRDIASEKFQAVFKALNSAIKSVMSMQGHFFKAFAFTDHLVITAPLSAHHHVDSAIFIVWYFANEFQSKLAEGGLTVRGGLAFGDVYAGNNMIFGPALLEAYGLEQAAIYPRILIADSIKERVISSRLDYQSRNETAYPTYFTKAPDGKLFVDYLERYVVPKDRPEEHIPRLMAHKALIENGLTEFLADGHVWEKYNWLKRYHNSFCEQYSSDTNLRLDDNDAALFESPVPPN